MIYILQKNLQNTKKLHIALQEIFGIGQFLAQHICDQLGSSKYTRVEQLTGPQIDQLIRIITQYSITGPDLQRLMTNDIKRLSRIGAYRGIRHIQKLPVRGQRTH